MTQETSIRTPFLPVPLAYVPELIQGDGATVHFRPDALRLDRAALDLPCGVSLLAAVRIAMRENGYKTMPRGFRIFVADTPFSSPVEVPRKDWGAFLIRHGMRVHVTSPAVHGGGGGKNPLNTILSLVVVAAAMFVGGWVSGPLLGKAVLGAGTFAATAFSSAVGGLAALVVMGGGMLLVNAIAPMSAPKLTAANSLGAEKVWSIDGTRNSINLYGAVPIVLGTVRFAPRFFANPYTYLSGNDQYARYLVGVLGHCKVGDIRIGDTDIAQYTTVRYNVYENWKGEAFRLFPAAVFQEDLGITLTGANGWHTRTTAADTVEIQWEHHFNRGLAHLNKKNQMSYVTVAFQAQYRAVGETEWRGAFGYTQTTGGTLGMTYPAVPANKPTESGQTATTRNDYTVYITASGGVGFSGVRAVGTASAVCGWTSRSVFPEGWYWERTSATTSASKSSANFTGSVSASGLSVIVSAGAYSNPDYSVKRGTLTPVRQGWGITVPQGQYEFRVRRTTPNADPNYIKDGTTMDESTWPVLKSLKAGPVIKYDGTPYTIIELDIKATDQLNGHINEINALFTSVCPVWDGETWTDGPGNNPASLCLMLATSPVIGRPVTMADMDFAAWQGFSEWCDAHGWAFNSVQTEQVTCSELMQPILSAARAAFSLRDGLFSVVWDTPDKPAGYPFGPRNSWGFRATKIFAEERIHGLRYLFLNQEKDYQEDEMIVYADGYNADNATNIVEAEQDGITDPKLIYKMGRLRLADAEWRPEVYEIQTDFSHLCVAKGDRIPVTYDVPMWGIQQARVMGVEHPPLKFEYMNKAALVSLGLERQSELAEGWRTVNGQRVLIPVAELSAWLNGLEADALRAIFAANDLRDNSLVSAVVIDDYVSMEDGKSYAFIYFSSPGDSVPYSVETEAVTTNVLRLQFIIPVSSAPLEGGLVHFGEAGRETHDCIVTAIETQDNMCAKITMQDYSADKIYAALTGPIPPWDSDITVPSRWQLGRPSAPVMTSVRTDEHALLQTANGTLVPRIQAGFSVAERRDVTVQTVRVEVREADSGAEWIDAGNAPASTGFVYAQNVTEGMEYEIRLVAVSTVGVGSDYSPVYRATVVGRLTPPPAPVAVYADGSRIWWEMPEEAPIDIRGYEIWMGFDEADPFSWARRISNEYVTAREFDIGPWSGWARRIWIRTRDDIDLVSEPVSISVNLGDMPVENVIGEVVESERGWPGSLTGGTLVPGLGLVSSGDMSAWGDIPMWGDLPWSGGNAQSIVYETTVVVPAEWDGATLVVDIVMPYGVLGSVEYAEAGSYPAWGDLPMWGDLPWSGILDPGEYVTARNGLTVSRGTAVTIRVTTANLVPSRIQEIVIGFDVEDAEPLKLGDVAIPSTGARLVVPDGYFRWISVANVTVQYVAGLNAFTAGFVDRGIIEGGFVTQGPLIQCKDENGALVKGSVDVLLQGARGCRALAP